MIDNGLKKYIEDFVLPHYKKNDKAHGAEHVMYVIERSVVLAKEHNADINMAYTAAALHDIGHYMDPANHEYISADIFLSDEFFKTVFSEESRILIYKAIQEHRSSHEKELSSIFSKILSTADRTTNVKKAIQRSIDYNKWHCPDQSLDVYFENIIEYLTDKYGLNGYSQVHLKDNAYDLFIKEMQQLLLDKEKLEALILDLLP